LFRQEYRGDQVAGEHEEKVDTEISTGKATEVKSDDRDDRHRPEPVQLRSIREPRAERIPGVLCRPLLFHRGQRIGSCD
jgi:hypothetical protein